MTYYEHVSGLCRHLIRITDTLGLTEKKHIKRIEQNVRFVRNNSIVSDVYDRREIMV